MSKRAQGGKGKGRVVQPTAEKLHPALGKKRNIDNPRREKKKSFVGLRGQQKLETQNRYLPFLKTVPWFKAKPSTLENKI